MNDEAKIFAKNLASLMEYHGHNQAQLATKCGVSQKTISNLLNPDETKSPNLSSVAVVAKAYKTPAWTLLYPNPPIKLLISGSLPKFVSLYVKSDEDSQSAWQKVLEAAAKYRV